MTQERRAPKPWNKSARHFHVTPDGNYRLAYEDCPCISNGGLWSFVPKPVPPKRFFSVVLR